MFHPQGPSPTHADLVPRVLRPFFARALLVGFLSLLAVLLVAGPAGAVSITSTIAVSNQAVPEGNGEFDTFTTPSLNASGQVAFLANLLNTSSSDDNSGIYLHNGSALVNLAREGTTPVPEGNGDFAEFSPWLVVNSAGQVSFKAALRDTRDFTDDSGIYLHDGSVLVERAREGSTEPGGNGEFSYFPDSFPLLNSAGEVAFRALLETGGGPGAQDNSGIYLYTRYGLVELAREGAAVPGGTGDFEVFSRPALNGAGQVVFRADLRNTGSSDTNSGIYLHNGSTLVELAREGITKVPEGNGYFAEFSPYAVLNRLGQVAFQADLRAVAGSGNDSGIYLHNGSVLVNLAREGTTPVPEGNGDFSNFGDPVLNSAGQVAFNADLRNTGSSDDDSGIYLHNGSTLVELAREGAAVPEGNGDFAQFSPLFSLPLGVNSAGQVVFKTNLRNTGSSDDDSGIYLTDGVEQLKVVREGDLLIGKTVTNTWIAAYSGGQDGRPNGLNDFAQVAYRAAFTDATEGIFLFTPEVHWRQSGSGIWDTATNWTLGIDPAEVHPVVIDPSVAAAVTGPAGNTTVKSLTIGGAAGTATLQVSAGGNLTVNETTTVAANGVLALAGGTLSTGALKTSGGGTVQLGSGTLNLTTADLTIGFGGALGTQVSIGSGGTFNVSNNASVSAAGILSIASGGAFSAATLNQSGVVELNGGAIAGGANTLTNQASGVLRGYGLIQPALTNNGGLIHANAGLPLVIENLVGNQNGGELRVADGSTLSIHSDFGNEGTIVLMGPGATLTGTTEGQDAEVFNSRSISGAGRITLKVANQNHGIIRAEGGRLTLAGSFHSNQPNATIEAASGAAVFYSRGLGTNEGTIALLGGAFDNNSLAITNTGLVAGHGTFRSAGLTNSGRVGVGGGDMSFIGDVTNSGTISIEEGDTAMFFGDLTGAGTTGPGDVMFFSGVGPGASPAAMSFGGSATFGAASELRIELGGYARGNEYDAMDVTGAARLDGAIRVSLLGNFAPSPGDEFPIMTFGSRSGEFDTVINDTPYAGLLFDVRYDDPAGTATLTADAALVGDVDLDGDVDFGDLDILLAGFGTIGGADWLDGELSGDGGVGDEDLNLLLSNFGAKLPATHPALAVPEPSAALLAMIALAVAAMMRPGPVVTAFLRSGQRSV